MVEELREKLPQIAELCQKHGVIFLDVFGSAARGDFDPTRSDFDFLVEFGPTDRRGFRHPYFALSAELQDLLGRQVHLVEEHCQDGDS